ncbi:MAG TPA: glycosyl hydrolase family 28-related protein [Metabacillus sp.]|nr:glycosyl hydrolase family 28-related protein [Metabacillus sp.]
MQLLSNSVELKFGGNVVKQGSETPFGFLFRGEDGNAVDLQNATVIVKIANEKALILEKTATVDVDNIVTFSLSKEDVTGSGKMRLEFQVTRSDGSVEKFPADNWQEIRITPSLDDLTGGSVAIVTVQSIQKQIDEIAKGATNAETSQARLGEDGTAYDTLKQRLDTENKNVNEQLADNTHLIGVNPKKYGIKGDGINDDTQGIRDMFADNEGKRLMIPDGDYRITSPIDIDSDVCLYLSPNARFFADAPMDYLFNYATSRTITTIYTLSKDRFIIGGKLDGNGLAKHVLRLNKFFHFTLHNVEIKNGINRGLVTNNIGGSCAELVATNLHFINETNTNILDNIAIENIGNDNHFADIFMVDWTEGLLDKGGAVGDRLHYWISHKERIEHSKAFTFESSSFFGNLYADTARYAVVVKNGYPKINDLKVYYNKGVYTSQYASQFKPVVYKKEGGALRMGFLENVANVDGGNNEVEGTLSPGDFLIHVSRGVNATNLFPFSVPKEEEGTFTPTVAGTTTAGAPTYTSQNGKYIRQGKLVTCTLTIKGTYDNTIAGGLLVKGLPFTMASGHVGAVSFGYIQGLKSPNGYVNTGQYDLTLRTIDTNGNSVAIDTTTLRGTAFEYHLSVTYRVS